MNQRGQALTETILLGLVLLVPLIWTLGVLADIHRTALAVTSAAHDASVAAAAASDPIAARSAIDDAVERALDSHRLDPRVARVSSDIDPRLRRGSALAIEVRVPVTVLQAPLIGRVSGPSIWVEARRVVRVPLYGSRG